MKQLTIEQQSPGKYSASGELTFSTINAKTLTSFQAAQGADEVTMDLKGVTAADSAGLALIIEWFKSAQNKRVKLHLENMPEQLLSLTRLGGLESILQFTDQ